MYVLIDSGRIGTEISNAKELNPDHDSLYRGTAEQSMASVAPYLFSFDPQTEFGNWYFQNGWGNSWGILIYSDIGKKALVKHLRHFLKVKKEDGEQLYFRFYDPRVLRVFLPTCDERQLRDFFGSIDYFICEDEDPANGLAFSLDYGELKVDIIKKSEVTVFTQSTKKNKSWWS